MCHGDIDAPRSACHIFAALFPPGLRAESTDNAAQNSCCPPVAELKVEASEADNRADIELDLIRAVAGIDLDAEERREGALPSVVLVEAVRGDPQPPDEAVLRVVFDAFRIVRRAGRQAFERLIVAVAEAIFEKEFLV